MLVVTTILGNFVLHCSFIFSIKSKPLPSPSLSSKSNIIASGLYLLNSSIALIDEFVIDINSTLVLSFIIF